MNARDQQGAAEQKREDNDGEFFEERDEPERTNVSDEPPFLDLNVFAAELTTVLESHDDDDDPDDDDTARSPFGTAPPGAPPAYRAAEANAMAEENSDDKIATPQPIIRPRFLDGFFDNEAAEGR